MGDVPDFTTGTVQVPVELGSITWGNNVHTLTVGIPGTAAGFLLLGQGTLTGAKLLSLPSNTDITPAGVTGVIGLEGIPQGDNQLQLAGGPDVVGAGSLVLYMFTSAALVYGDPALPLPVKVTQQGGVDQEVDIHHLGGGPAVGQQLAAASLPVVPASDLPLGKQGQQLAAASLPVVLASDQLPLPVDQRAIDFSSGNTAGGGGSPTVVITPPAGKRVVFSQIRWALGNGVASPGVLAEVSDATNGVYWAEWIGIGSATNNPDHVEARNVRAPNVGTAQTIKFSAAPAAASSLDASGWYV